MPNQHMQETIQNGLSAVWFWVVDKANLRERTQARIEFRALWLKDKLIVASTPADQNRHNKGAGAPALYGTQDDFYVLGKVYLEQGNLVRALKWLKLAVNANEYKAINDIIYIQLYSGEYEEAKKTLEDRKAYLKDTYTYIMFVLNLLQNSQAQALQNLRTMKCEKFIPKVLDDYNSEFNYLPFIIKVLTDSSEMDSDLLYGIFWLFQHINGEDVIDQCMQRDVALCGYTMFELCQIKLSPIYLSDYDIYVAPQKMLKLYLDKNKPIYLDKHFKKKYWLLSENSEKLSRCFSESSAKSCLKLLFANGLAISGMHASLPTASMLINAIKSKKYTHEEIKSLLESELCHVSQRDMFDGNSMLHKAILLEDSALVELFLQQDGVNLKLENNKGQVVLDLAILSKNSKIIQLLLPYVISNGKLVDEHYISEYTLQNAIRLNYPDIASAIVSVLSVKDLNTEFEINNSIVVTPLELAIACHMNTLVIELVDLYGCEVKIKHLSIAIIKGNTDIFRKLYASCDIMDGNIEQVLYCAITYKNIELVKFINESAAHLNVNGDF